ncbi:MAG: pyridoxal-dependent decarboxylase, partial [Candidatus Nanopelagicales bacterium]
MSDEPRDGLAVPPDVLDVDPERLRALGHWVVDRTVEHLTTLGDRPALTVSDHDTLMAALGGPLPRTPGDVEASLAL